MKDYLKFKSEIIQESKSDGYGNITKERISKWHKNAVREAKKKSKTGKTVFVYQNKFNFKFVVCLACKEYKNDPYMLVDIAEYGECKEINKIITVAEEGFKLAYQSLYAVLNEALSFKGRRGLKRAAKRRKARLAIGRKQAKRRTAPMKKLLNRAQRRARKNIAKHISGGRDITKLSHAGKNRLQQMVNARSGQLDQLRRKLLPAVRKADRKKN